MNERTPNYEARFFVGANNETKVLEIEKLQRRLALYFSGWFITTGHGAWVDNHDEVKTEPSALVIVYTVESQEACERIASIIAADLQQYSVGLAYNNGPLRYIDRITPDTEVKVA